MAFSTSRCQVLNQNANTALDITGASIDKACSCPSFLHTHFAHICGTCGFLLQNPSLQHSGILTSKQKATDVNPSANLSCLRITFFSSIVRQLCQLSKAQGNFHKLEIEFRKSILTEKNCQHPPLLHKILIETELFIYPRHPFWLAEIIMLAQIVTAYSPNRH